MFPVAPILKFLFIFFVCVTSSKSFSQWNENFSPEENSNGVIPSKFPFKGNENFYTEKTTSPSAIYLKGNENNSLNSPKGNFHRVNRLKRKPKKFFFKEIPKQLTEKRENSTLKGNSTESSPLINFSDKKDNSFVKGNIDSVLRSKRSLKRDKKNFPKGNSHEIIIFETIPQRNGRSFPEDDSDYGAPPKGFHQRKKKYSPGENSDKVTLFKFSPQKIEKCNFCKRFIERKIFRFDHFRSSKFPMIIVQKKSRPAKKFKMEEEILLEYCKKNCERYSQFEGEDEYAEYERTVSEESNSLEEGFSRTYSKDFDPLEEENERKSFRVTSRGKKKTAGNLFHDADSILFGSNFPKVMSMSRSKRDVSSEQKKNVAQIGFKLLPSMFPKKVVKRSAVISKRNDSETTTVVTTKPNVTQITTVAASQPNATQTTTAAKSQPNVTQITTAATPKPNVTQITTVAASQPNSTPKSITKTPKPTTKLQTKVPTATTKRPKKNNDYSQLKALLDDIERMLSDRKALQLLKKTLSVLSRLAECALSPLWSDLESILGVTLPKINKKSCSLLSPSSEHSQSYDWSWSWSDMFPFSFSNLFR